MFWKIFVQGVSRSYTVVRIVEIFKNSYGKNHITRSFRWNLRILGEYGDVLIRLWVVLGPPRGNCYGLLPLDDVDRWRWAVNHCVAGVGSSGISYCLGKFFVSWKARHVRKFFWWASYTHRTGATFIWKRTCPLTCERLWNTYFCRKLISSHYSITRDIGTGLVSCLNKRARNIYFLS